MDTEAAGIPTIRTFDLIVPVSGYLEGTLDDWPAVIQDGVYAALERKAHEVGLPPSLHDLMLASHCGAGNSSILFCMQLGLFCRYA